MTAVGLAPNVVSYGSVITACAKAGQWKMAAKLGEMAAVGLTPNVITYNAAIDACAKEGE